jgi:hypothetical protein
MKVYWYNRGLVALNLYTFASPTQSSKEEAVYEHPPILGKSPEKENFHRHLANPSNSLEK